MKTMLNDYLKSIEEELTKKQHDKSFAEEILTEYLSFNMKDLFT